MADDERRQDPRTDASFSLTNLLRVRARRHAFDLAVVSTDEGVLMATSRAGNVAERAAAHASALGPTSSWGDDGKKTLVGRRLDVDGRPVLLAVVRRDGGTEDPVLDDLADRVKAILHEHRARLAA